MVYINKSGTMIIIIIKIAYILRLYDIFYTWWLILSWVTTSLYMLFFKFKLHKTNNYPSRKTKIIENLENKERWGKKLCNLMAKRGENTKLKYNDMLV